MSDRRLLAVVDDEDDLREFLCSVVQGQGYDTVDFGRPDELLAYVQDPQKAKPTAILSDINMPGMSGLDLLTKVRGFGHRLPVVFLTGNHQTESVVQAVRLGASDFLFKPCKPIEIELVVNRALELGHRIEQVTQALTTLKNQNPALAKDLDALENMMRYETLSKALNAVKRAS